LTDSIKGSLKNIRLIVLDIDGTLLTDEGVIGSKTKELIHELSQKGVKFSFASGRLHSAITVFAEELNIDTPLISLDGCLIKSYPGNHVLFESHVKQKHVKRTLDFAEKYLINICLCHDDAIYFTEINSVIPQVTEKFGAKFQQVEDYKDYISRTLEVLMASDSKEALKYVYNKMIFPYCAGLNKSWFRSHAYENIYYLEIRRKGSSKGKGLQRLMKYLKISPYETAVVGDWYNDLSLFQKGTINVAVANAVAELKRNADIVTEKTNNEDGVGEFLENVLKSKNQKDG
jgi:Cof subfamily protein (haloacid dehalogenase superfamily)